METNLVQQNKPSKFYRFQVAQGTLTKDNKFEKNKSVGMAYLKEGQSTYTLRLWTFLNDRFYIITSKNDPSRYLVMTREPNKNPNSKNKYYWNIVGNGQADSLHGIIRFDFDLFEKPIYMSIFPESSTQSTHSVELEDLEYVA
ncbi:MAG: hypothetical protein AB7F59_09640 [Bdellovibrionales bacterium]